MMDEHQSPSPNKKRKSAVALPSQKRLLVKKTKIAGDLTGTCAALSQSPSKISFNSSPTSSKQTTRIPSKRNAKAGPSTMLNAASHSRDLAIPTRVSSRVSRPTFKKRASLVRKSRSPESDGTPPLSIIPLLPSSPLKQRKPTSSSTKRLAGNNTPSKRKCRNLGLDPNPIEITSSDDGSRLQPPRKRVKHTHKKPSGSEVIDLCSESEDVIASPRHTRKRGRSVVVLSTDEEVDLELPALGHLAIRKIDTRESPALPPFRDISPPIEIESVFQASPSPQAHNTPVPQPKVPVLEEDGVTDENSIHTEKVNLPRGSLQVLYNEALARCTRETRREKVAGEPSPFSSLKCVPPARIIRHATQTQSPSLHTPLFFSRIIFRLRDRRKQPKTLDAKAFSDAQASFSNPKAFPHAKAFPAISDDIGLNSMEVSKLNEDQDTLTYSDAVMEISGVDSEALEPATETVSMPPIDSQDDTSSDTQVASISPSIPDNNIDVNEGPVPRSLESPSPLTNQASPLRPEVTILEDTRILHSIQAQRVSTNCRPTTPDRANSFAISANMLCNTPSNSDAVDYENETSREAETSLFEKEKFVDHVATIEPILKDALQRKYDASKICGISLHPELELSDTAKPSAAFELLSELPTECSSITSYVAISSSVHTSSASKCLPELSMATLNLSLPAGPSSSSGLECLSESPTIPNLPPLTSPSGADTLSSRASSPSPCSRQSLDSSATIETVDCHLLTPDDSPSPFTPPVKAQKLESPIRPNPFPSPIDVSLFDIDMSELNSQTMMFNMFGEDDDDDDDISISGMVLAYPEELQNI